MGGNGVSSGTSRAINNLARAMGANPNTVLRQARSLARSGGITLGGAVLRMTANWNQQNQNAQVFANDWAKMTDGEADTLRRSMGQDGWEAGHLGDKWAPSFINGKYNPNSRMYAGTGKSMLINSALDHNLKQGQIVQQYVLDGTPFWAHRFGSTYTLKDVKNDIRHIDSGMKPLTKTINTIRGESSQQVLEQFGLNGLTTKQLFAMDNNGINQLLYGRERYKQSYTSSCWNKDGFKIGKDRDVVVQYTIRKGVDAIITKNTKESEVVVGRGYAQKITSAKVQKVNGIKRLVINVTIEPSNRPAVIKV